MQRNSATRTHTFAHELGHNFGAGHDIDTSPSGGIFDYSYGYCGRDNGEGSPNWATIVSYTSGCGASRIPYFSTPNHTYNGDPLGAADRDNGRTMNETREFIMNYFPSIVDQAYSQINLSFINSSALTPLQKVDSFQRRGDIVLNPGTHSFVFQNEDASTWWGSNVGTNTIPVSGQALENGTNISVEALEQAWYRISINTLTGEYRVEKRPRPSYRTSASEHVYINSTANSGQFAIMDHVEDYARQIMMNFRAGDTFTFYNYGRNSSSYRGEANPTTGITTFLGEPIQVNNAGTYLINFNDRALTYELIGPLANHNFNTNVDTLYVRSEFIGWDMKPMIPVADNLWQVDYYANDLKFFKFDVLGEWSQNYGEDNADGFADSAGDDIP